MTFRVKVVSQTAYDRYDRSGGHGRSMIDVDDHDRPQEDRHHVHLHDDRSFSCIGGILAMLIRAQLARPRMTLLGRAHVQSSLHAARHGDDLPCDRALWTGACQFSGPAADRRARRGFSALNATAFWLFVCRRPHRVLRRLPATAARRRRAGLRTRRSRRSLEGTGAGQDLWLDRACCSPASPRFSPRINFMVDDLPLPRAGHDDVAHADLRMGDRCDRGTDFDGVSVALRRLRDAVDRPSSRRPFLRPCLRRKSDPLPASCFGSSAIPKST